MDGGGHVCLLKLGGGGGRSDRMQRRGGGEVPLRMPRMREGWTLYDERVRAISWMMLLRPGQRPPHVITPNTARRWQGECRANHRQHEQANTTTTCLPAVAGST